MASDGRRNQPRAEQKATSSQAVPKGVPRHLTSEDADFRRAEDMLLGIFDSDYEEKWL